MARAGRPSRKGKAKGPSEVPPGATRQAHDRSLQQGGPGSGAGPRHAAGDAGSAIESYGPADSNQPLADDPVTDEPGPLEKGPPYSGVSGGAVGGTPAEDRSSGGNTGRGLAPGGVHRGDSTVGAGPEPRRHR